MFFDLEAEKEKKEEDEIHEQGQWEDPEKRPVMHPGDPVISRHLSPNSLSGQGRGGVVGSDPALPLDWLYLEKNLFSFPEAHTHLPPFFFF